MTSKHRLLAVGGLVFVLASLQAYVFIAQSRAASPWWHLTSGARPTNLKSGRLEEQEVVVNATGGEFILSEPVATEKGEFEVLLNGVEVPAFAVLPDAATAAEVQAGLEGFYGVGTVHVTGGPEGGASRYRITFEGALAYQPLKAIGTHYSEEFGYTGAEQLRTRVVVLPSSGQLVVTAANLGTGAATGSTKIADQLPEGLRAVTIEGVAGPSRERPIGPVQCDLATVTCTYTGNLPPYEQIEIRIGVAVEGAVSGELNEVSVSGGGAPRASIARPVTISEAPTPFGVEGYELGLEEEGGAPDTQAGSHPFQLTTTLALNEVEGAQPAALTKDLTFKLPPGLIGNPTPFPQCAQSRFLTRVEGIDNECPENTVVGVARVTINDPRALHLTTLALPLYSLEPEVGEPARFGFLALFTPVYIDTSVRTGGDYGVTAEVRNIGQAVGFLKSEVTFWGVPGDSRHNAQRGWGCLEEARGTIHTTLPCETPQVKAPPPLIGLPTSCTGALQTSVEADSWKQPGATVAAGPSEALPALDGCNRLPFGPSISVTPDGQNASSPTGLAVDVHVPQEDSLNPKGLAQANVKNTTVTLPAGVALDPAAGDGLQGCSIEQAALDTTGASGCPEASKVGTVEVRTPLLPNPLRGSAYVAAQDANPFGSLVALYVFVEDPISGSIVKLAGDVHLSESGQITSTFENTPQLPFEDFKLHFFGGSRAPLSTPASCGAYTTDASVEPWSGNPAVSASSTFQITAGPNGSACPGGALPFSPSLAAGTTNIQAGGFSPLTTTITREDGQQGIQAVSLHMPPGLLGLLSSVKLCGEPQASQGTCGPESLIGETIVSVGLGQTPYSVTGGKVYITGGYEGAPYGLSIVNPAKAGPYDLGRGTACDCVLVRAKVEVDPHTAQLTVTTDSTGPYKIPSVLDGIPLQIKHVNVTINRAGFTFNPTNCAPMTVTGSVASTQGSSQPVATPFQVTDCATLGFKPAFAVRTSAKTSRANGASLAVKLTYPHAPFGSQANIRSVKVELPKQLPSRLSTLQKACTAAQFAANPAGCPAASVIGHATATTPLLPVALTGAAYFVSNGGEAFPSLVIVLQGYGVTLDLVGATHISKQGITSTTFKTIPDAPVGSFELSLPEGRYSALTAIGSLCKAKLAMPTEFVAQDGALITKKTPIAVNGCPKAKRRQARHARRAKHAKHA